MDGYSVHTFPLGYAPRGKINEFYLLILGASNRIENIRYIGRVAGNGMCSVEVGIPSKNNLYDDLLDKVVESKLRDCRRKIESKSRKNQQAVGNFREEDENEGYL